VSTVARSRQLQSLILLSAAYFSQAKLDQLCTIDNVRGVGDVPVPEGWFRSARIGKTRRDSRAHHPTGTLSFPAESSLQASSPLLSKPISNFPPDHYASSSFHHSPHPPHSPTHSTYSNKSTSHSPTSSFSSSGSNSSYPRRGPGLVPLEVLQSASPLPRDPVDAQALRRFAP
jgi:hypothetical protein